MTAWVFDFDMIKYVKRLTSLIIVLVLLMFSVSVSAAEVQGSGFAFNEYPEEAVTAFTPEMLTRVHGEADYEANRGYADTSLYISPDWTLKVNGRSVPLYATLSYDASYGGVLSAFQYLYAQGSAFKLNISLTFKDAVSGGICLPEGAGVGVQTQGRELKAELDGTGTYTFLINGDDQRYAVTLFVREYCDEEAEIASYIERYGEENVKVYEKGCYSLDGLSLESRVTYFRRGSFIRANHLADTVSAETEGQLGDFMYLNGGENVTVTGMGTVDFNSLDWHERTHGIIRWSKNVLIEGMLFLNPSSWTLSAYGCENCKIRDIAVFGYRTNSDGINICGCSNMLVASSFCRNGDDCFSVKTTNDAYEAKGIEFTDCIGWSTKARCFGITGEVFEKISDVEFSDCAVIYRNATWDNDRVCSLSVMVEAGGKDVENAVFRNIEIYHDSGRPVLVMISGDELDSCNISGVRFENIACGYAGEKSKISSQRDITSAGKAAAKINRFLADSGLSGLRLFALIGEWLSSKYNSGSGIEAAIANSSVNGSSLASRRALVSEGNVRLIKE